MNASTYGDGAQDATAGIQAAINGCPSGQVVQLSAGNFKVGGTTEIVIDKSITLRGAGATRTFLRKSTSNTNAIIQIGEPWIPSEAGSTNLTANAPKGATSVQVASASGISVGQLVVLTILTDSSYVTWGAQAEVQPGGEGRGWFTRYDRPIGQMLEVASISGNTISFTTPLHIAFDTAHTAQLTRYSVPATKYAGLEDLYVRGGMNDNIAMRYAMYSWLRSVESDWSNGESIGLNACFRCVVRDSYFHDTPNPTPGGAGYMLSFAWYTSDTLVENNIFMNANKVMVMRASGGGNVIGYNYFDNGQVEYAPGWVETGINASHLTCPHFELFEGNQAFNADGDNTWGGAVYITYFRNHLTGKRRDFSDEGNRRAAGLMYGHYYTSFVGNVLGTAGQDPAPMSHFAYEDLYPWDEGDEAVMWRLGYNPEDWSAPAEARVVNTVHRHANFDYVTNSVHWATGYDQTLPASLYLTSKPAFFGSLTWPWVDATGTTKTYTLPARARYDGVLPPTTHTLTATKTGTGTGTVTSSPAGISCGTDCSEPYSPGTVVTLTAAATAGSSFAGWSGACTGTAASCQVTMSAAQAVTATFNLNPYTLTVTKAGTGSGTVTSSPTGISCGTDCSEPYSPGTVVTLTAAATAGSSFAGWSGACTGTAASCQVTMSAAQAVTATFTLSPYTLTVTKAGTGSGTVTSSPTGISCGTDCSEPYSPGTVVTLTAAATAGSSFAGWSGACTGTASCSVTMSAAQAVTATFNLSPYTLTVTKAGTGSGTVTSSPAGISCGTDCSEPYSPGTVVTLTAAATAGSSFAGWSGACTGTASCSVTMSAAQAVTATFTLSPYTLTVTKTGTGTRHRHLLSRRHQLRHRLLRALQPRNRRHPHRRRRPPARPSPGGAGLAPEPAPARSP